MLPPACRGCAPAAAPAPAPRPPWLCNAAAAAGLWTAAPAPRAPLALHDQAGLAGCGGGQMRGPGAEKGPESLRGAGCLSCSPGLPLLVAQAGHLEI